MNCVDCCVFSMNCTDCCLFKVRATRILYGCVVVVVSFLHWKLSGGVATGQGPTLSLRLPRGQSFALQRTVPVAAAVSAAGGVVVWVSVRGSGGRLGGGWGGLLF